MVVNEVGGYEVNTFGSFEVTEGGWLALRLRLMVVEVVVVDHKMRRFV